MHLPLEGESVPPRSEELYFYWAEEGVVISDGGKKDNE